MFPDGPEDQGRLQRPLPLPQATVLPRSAGMKTWGLAPRRVSFEQFLELDAMGENHTGTQGLRLTFLCQMPEMSLV